MPVESHKFTQVAAGAAGLLLAWSLLLCWLLGEAISVAAQARNVHLSLIQTTILVQFKASAVAGWLLVVLILISTISQRSRDVFIGRNAAVTYLLALLYCIVCMATSAILFWIRFLPPI